MIKIVDGTDPTTGGIVMVAPILAVGVTTAADIATRAEEVVLVQNPLLSLIAVKRPVRRKS